MARTAPASFPKWLRIRKRREYLCVQNRGRKLHSDSFLVFVLRPEEARGRSARFGATVSKKVGGAVERNRVKRLVREVCRRNKTWFPDGVEVVFVAKRAAVELDYPRAEREVGRLCARHLGR